MRITKPALPPKYPNTVYDAAVLDSAENANIFWEKPGRFVVWKIPGSDLIDTYRIVEDSPTKLMAVNDDAVGHAEMRIDKRSRHIRITSGRAVGDVRLIQEGSCAPPKHDANPFR